VEDVRFAVLRRLGSGEEEEGVRDRRRESGEKEDKEGPGNPGRRICPVWSPLLKLEAEKGIW
jgi:hypothetical protein